MSKTTFIYTDELIDQVHILWYECGYTMKEISLSLEISVARVRYILGNW